MIKKMLIFVMLLSTILLASCAGVSATDVYNEASKYIEIKMKTGDKKPTDSIAINFDPAYFKLAKCQGAREREFEFIQNGYRIWVLETADTFRIEVDRIDTLGYIYKR